MMDESHVRAACLMHGSADVQEFFDALERKFFDLGVSSESGSDDERHALDMARAVKAIRGEIDFLAAEANRNKEKD